MTVVKFFGRNTSCATARQQLKARRNTILERIRQQINDNQDAEIEKRTNEINAYKDSTRMFQAVKELTSNKPQKLVVKNAEGEIVAQQEEAAELVATHFKTLLNSTFFSSTLRSSVTSNKQLNAPITSREVSEATNKLRNGRAVGPDGVPGELLKYGDDQLHSQMADIFNAMFEKDENLELGQGTLIVLPKPGKPPGLMSSLRPIVLLNTLRKTLSLITLNRIRPAVERFLPSSQSGFRKNRSTSDAVWAHKWMIARIMKAREEFIILGVDMSRAFDTLERQKMLDGLQSIIDEDSLRMVYTLLDKTTLQAKLGTALSKPFDTNIGAPQGDSLSPVMFTVYLELAMREIRAACPRPAQDLAVPNEIIYADDTDFVSTSQDVINNIEPRAKTILAEHNLAMNTEKTERTVLRRETTKEEETWRTTKKLGTLLGEPEEMRRRKQLVAFSFNNLWRIWSRKRNKISTERRLRLYNAYITPILTYNACTWALTESEMEELEAFRRRQLRHVIGINYPRRISNDDLNTRCNMKELAYTIRGSRWRMLGHTLRMTDDTPAKYATTHYFDPVARGFLGRPRLTLPLVIDKDLQLAATQPPEHVVHQFRLPARLKTIKDLERLNILAEDRKQWMQIVACVTDMQVTRPLAPTIRRQPHRNAKQ